MSSRSRWARVATLALSVTAGCVFTSFARADEPDKPREAEPPTRAPDSPPSDAPDKPAAPPLDAGKDAPKDAPRVEAKPAETHDAKDKKAEAAVELPATRPGCPADSKEERCRAAPKGGKWQFEPGLTVYAQYALSLRAEAGKTQWFHQFELTRAHAWLGVRYGSAHARVLLEAVRSASEGALLGVATNSFVMRVREAYVGYALFDHLDLRLGLLPTLTIPVVERSFSLRAVNPSGLERAGLASPADLGVTAVGTLPKGFGFVGVGGYNGEGYNRPELNRGKNVEIAAEIHPVAIVDAAAPLTVFGSYMSGSSGTGSARANRVNVGAAWQGDIVRGGLAFTYALGVADQGAQNAYVVDTFVKVQPIELLVFGADFTYWKRDAAKPTNDAYLITASAGVKPLYPFGAYLAFDKQIFGAAAKAALPSEDSYRFRVIAAMEMQ